MKLYTMESAPFADQGNGTACKIVHADKMTMASWRINKDTAMAAHRHPQEQVAYLLSGHMRFQLEHGTVELKAGQAIVFDGNELHGGFAIEDSVILDVFSSVREDFKQKLPALSPA